jgi:hypothetical protein
MGSTRPCRKDTIVLVLEGHPVHAKLTPNGQMAPGMSAPRLTRILSCLFVIFRAWFSIGMSEIEIGKMERERGSNP